MVAKNNPFSLTADLCRCGQPMDRIHCPSCGSQNTRARGGMDYIEDQNVPRYVCRRCAFRFNAVTWGMDYCLAPRKGTKGIAKLAALVQDIRAKEIDPDMKELIQEQYANNPTSAVDMLFAQAGLTSKKIKNEE